MKLMTDRYQPLILIGAARSGTRLVRDLIAEHPDVDKVAYDVNYIWRLGNETVPHDELSIELLTPQIQQRIWRKFESFRSGAPFLIEKTVQNCLRVPYVCAVFPKARFIYLIRNGWDVVESAYREWTAPPDWGYILKKARTFPLTEAFGYALDYAGGTFRRLMTQDKTKISTTWGPRYTGIDEDIATKEVLEVCAIQWARSVEKSLFDLSSLSAEQVLTIRYEEFVQRPAEHLQQIAQFAGFDPGPYAQLSALQKVSPGHIGKGFRQLSTEQRALVQPHLQNVLSLLEYV
jgi:hypothetical protein